MGPGVRVLILLKPKLMSEPKIILRISNLELTHNLQAKFQKNCAKFRPNLRRKVLDNYAKFLHICSEKDFIMKINKNLVRQMSQM